MRHQFSSGELFWSPGKLEPVLCWTDTNQN